MRCLLSRIVQKINGKATRDDATAFIPSLHNPVVAGRCTRADRRPQRRTVFPKPMRDKLLNLVTVAHGVSLPHCHCLSVRIKGV